MLRNFIVLILFLFTNTVFGNGYKVGMLLDQLEHERWQRDRDLFVAKATENGLKVYVKTANGDETEQHKQIENMVKRGVNVLVIVAVKTDGLRESLALAKSKGIKVLAYDRLITNADIDFYVSFDNTMVGQLQVQSLLKAKSSGNYFLIGGSPSDNNAKLVRQGQMKALQPAIEAGTVKVVGDVWADGWSSEHAYSLTTELLKKEKNVSAIVASNDSTAEGAINALTEANLAGKVAVSGQDADLSALRRIVKGVQTLTVYKPIESLANQAVDVVISLAKGAAIKTDNALDNGFKKVPSILLKPIAVDKRNIESTVIADGFQSKREIFN